MTRPEIFERLRALLEDVAEPHEIKVVLGALAALLDGKEARIRGLETALANARAHKGQCEVQARCEILEARLAEMEHWVARQG